MLFLLPITPINGSQSPEKNTVTEKLRISKLLPHDQGIQQDCAVAFQLNSTAGKLGSCMRQ